MQKNILNELQPIFRKIFSDTELIVIREMSAKDVARWDSLTHLNMIHEVEKHFGIKFKLKELTGMKNVGDMVDLIMAKKSS